MSNHSNEVNNKTQKKGFLLSLPKVLVILSSVTVLSAVVVITVLSGGPFYQRQVKFDDKRLDRLNSLARGIEEYYSDYDKALPKGMDTLEGYLKSKMNARTIADDFNDPETGSAFEYLVDSNHEYRLCAVFSTDNTYSTGGRGRGKYGLSTHYSYYRYSRLKGYHPKGRHCFKFKLSK